MFKKTLGLLLVMVLVLSMSNVHGQESECENALAPRLAVGSSARVSYMDGSPLNVRASAGKDGEKITQFAEGKPFQVIAGPTCADDSYWWQVQVDAETTGWIAEGADGVYFVEPAPILTSSFVPWDWTRWANQPDPLAITVPPVYRGDLPALPVNASNVAFLDDPALNDTQRAVLLQNGFVVVPGSFKYFDDVYQSQDGPTSLADLTDWQNYDPATDGFGRADFVTTDAMLHSLHFIFDRLLTDLEHGWLHATMAQQVLLPTLQAAHQQVQDTAGTPLEAPALTAELYLAVALELLTPGQVQALVSADQYAQVQTIAGMVQAAQGIDTLPLLADYQEDFTQYIPRGHYAGDPDLENYFRGMMWLGRITFRAKYDTETQAALLVLRALLSAPGAYENWQLIQDTLQFLIGPCDDLTPIDYRAVAEPIYGADLPLDALSDPAQLGQVVEQIKALPAPRVNGMVLPATLEAEDTAAETRGFRLMGQRFTFDGYVMGQMMSPYVGTFENPRVLPLGLDVAATLGSETAYNLAVEAGAAEYTNYDTQITRLTGELGVLTDEQWLENTYGGWLWTLKPLFSRAPVSYPPLMNTAAWLRKDLHTGLGSWTELKHDTVLYAKQPTGRGGGGGGILTSFGYVEPNPLVFARIAILAALTYQGLEQRNLLYDTETGRMFPSANQLNNMAFHAAQFAEIARKELNGEALSENEYWSIVFFGGYLEQIRDALDPEYEGQPTPMPVITDVASNSTFQVVLQEAVGNPDLIYVIIPAPDGGYQVARGGVFSYYEFVNDISARMTDQEWRANVEAGNLPPRPTWISMFYSQ